MVVVTPNDWMKNEINLPVGVKSYVHVARSVQVCWRACASRVSTDTRPKLRTHILVRYCEYIRLYYNSILCSLSASPNRMLKLRGNHRPKSRCALGAILNARLRLNRSRAHITHIRVYCSPGCVIVCVCKCVCMCVVYTCCSQWDAAQASHLNMLYHRRSISRFAAPAEYIARVCLCVWRFRAVAHSKSVTWEILPQLE